MDMNYCRRCGAKLMKLNPFSYACSNHHQIYHNPTPTVGAFMLNRDKQVLMGVRTIEPNKGMLNIPGGFIDGNETLEQGLEREIKEEIGLSKADYSTPVYLMSATYEYAYAEEINPVLCSLFVSYISKTARLTSNDDLADLRWIHVDEVRIEEIGNNDVRKGFVVLKNHLNNKS